MCFVMNMDENEVIEGLKKIVGPSNLGYHDLLNIISTDIKNKFVPIEIFTVVNLNPLEAIIKYHLRFNFTEIAFKLSRDPRNIWKVYNNGMKKINEKY